MSTRSGFRRHKAEERRACRSCGYSYVAGRYRQHCRESAIHRAKRKGR